jgi:hypothetical protein
MIKGGPFTRPPFHFSFAVEHQPGQAAWRSEGWEEIQCTAFDGFCTDLAHTLCAMKTHSVQQQPNTDSSLPRWLHAACPGVAYLSPLNCLDDFPL